MKLFGDGGLKGFLAYHGEKILFFGACLLAVLLILNGFNKRQALETSKSPSSLKSNVDRTREHIDGFKWSQDYEGERDSDQEFLVRAKETTKPISTTSYEMQQQLRPPVSPPPGRRDDPVLLAATELQVRPGYGALSTSNRSRINRPDDNAPFSAVDLDEEPIDPDDEDIRPLPGRQMSAGRTRFSSNDKPKGIYFVAVTALVPLREQFVNYQTALRNASGFDPGRDVPSIYDWELQRATVGEDGAEPQWKTVAKLSEILDNRQSGIANRNPMVEGADDFDPRFRDPNLTMDVPNISARSIGDLVIHDRIARLTDELKAKAAAEQDADDARDPMRGPRRGGPRPGRPGEGMMDDGMMMDPSMYEGGRPPMMMQGRPGGREMMGSRAAATDISGDMAVDEVPEYRMFRYIDQEVDPGTAYQYRLRLVWDDPNKPMMASGPGLNTLEPTVQERITSVDLNAEGRSTDFSETSHVVRVREGSTMLVGSVQPPDYTSLRVDNQTLSIRGPYKEPVAQVMAVEFDQERASDIPIEKEIRRGFVGNFFERELWVPIFWKGHLKREDHVFRMDNLVVDIRGGETPDESLLERRDGPRVNEYADLLTAPGRLLVREPSGAMRIRHEFEDSEAFLELAEAIKPEEKQPTEGMMPERGMPPGFPGRPPEGGEGFRE